MEFRSSQKCVIQEDSSVLPKKVASNTLNNQTQTNKIRISAAALQFSVELVKQ